MTLRHGVDLFTDVFVLLRDGDGRWWIANKAYDRLHTPGSASTGPSITA